MNHSRDHWRGRSIWTVTLHQIVACMVFIPSGLVCARPINLYLTYPDNPCSTITVNCHTWEEAETLTVHYDKVPRGGNPEAYAQQVKSRRKQIAGLPDGRWIHWADLRDLEPGTAYYFIVGDERGGFSRERSFRTVPSGESPIRFITGGDMGVKELCVQLLHWAGRQDPLFAVIGGDIAYADGDLARVDCWDSWFRNWDQEMLTSDGRMVPIVAAIGNHEINELPSSDPFVRAPFFTGFFWQQHEGTFFSRRFGECFSLIVLDTGHLVPHHQQVPWLEEELRKSQDLPVRLAVYHMPLYPSSRSFEDLGSVEGRRVWAPLFEKYRLTTAFENHDHCFKRSKLLKSEAIDPEGVLYLGNGCFGVEPREVGQTRRWYEEKALAQPHFWIVDVDRGRVSCQAMNQEGKVFDRYVHPQ
ncbi:MAG: hypothetical protein GHCLOJNM_02025 [bacterium]|nr:hypothetical protein [bacterium]